MQKSSHRYDDMDYRIISSSTIRSRTDNMGTSLSLNPYRQEVLGPVSNDVQDTEYPYRTFVVDSMSDNIATLHLSPNTAYSITVDAMCSARHHTTKVYYEMLIRCTDTIEKKIVYSSRHTIGIAPDDVCMQTSHIGNMSIRIHANEESRWVARISILRSPLLRDT